MAIDREITITLAPREDGGLRAWSDDLPGLVLSHISQRLVLQDLGLAIIELTTPPLCFKDSNPEANRST